MVMIFQPKGVGTQHKEGTILVQATLAAGTGIPGDASVGWYGSDYTIDAVYLTGIPTGEINGNYNARFTGCAPCLFQCGPC